MRRILPFLLSTPQRFFSAARPDFPLKIIAMPQSQTGNPSVGWIKFLAILAAALAVILVALIIVLGMFVWRLEVLTDSLVGLRRSTQRSSPTPEQSVTPTPTEAPVMKAIPIATPELTPSPSPQPTQVPHRRRHR
jgi:hypothetical protein